MEGLGDSLDLIPIAAWHGNGRKAQWWSPVLLGLWNPETDRPVAVCKCMSGTLSQPIWSGSHWPLPGFTDAFYKVILHPNIVPLTYAHCSQWNNSTTWTGIIVPNNLAGHAILEVTGHTLKFTMLTDMRRLPPWRLFQTTRSLGYQRRRVCSISCIPFFELFADENSVTESPVSASARGLVSSSRGLSLRFPRFIKTREDKHIEQASTPVFLADMYLSQRKQERANDEGELIDVESIRSSSEEEG